MSADSRAPTRHSRLRSPPGKAGRASAGSEPDANGGYCLVWAFERAVPMIYVEDSAGRTVGPPVRLGILDGPGAPPPPGCTVPDADIPWDRSDDVTGTWQYRSLYVVTFATVLLLMVGLVRGRGWRPGIALAGAALALWAGLWLI